MCRVDPGTPHRRKPSTNTQARTPEDPHVPRLIFSDVTYTRDPAFKLSHGNISVKNQTVVGATTVFTHLQWLTGGRSNHQLTRAVFLNSRAFLKSFYARHEIGNVWSCVGRYALSHCALSGSPLRMPRRPKTRTNKLLPETAMHI